MRVQGLCFGIFFVSTIKVPSFWVAPVKASAATWFDMYVCMYVCTYVCMYACMCVYRHLGVHI